MKRSVTLVFCVALLLVLSASAALASEFGDLTAKIDSDKRVTVKGAVSSGAGQTVNIKITDPNGKLEYADSVVSAAFGGFEISYIMTNSATGKYEVKVNALNAGGATASFDYGTDNKLKGLSISKGGFDKAFSADVKEYAVTVDKRIDSVTVTPSVNDGTASVKVNDKAQKSGEASAPIKLNDGVNTIKIAVTSLDGVTNTYTITVTKETALLADLTAEASLDGEKNVTVSGTVSTGAGQLISLAISDPDGKTEYLGQTVSAADGRFSFSYKLVNPANGRYTAALGALGVSGRVTAHFDYLEMYNITVSGITLNPSFNNDVLTYSASVKEKTESITVTPTAVDGKAYITVDTAAVASGTTSTPIKLEKGVNTITVVLTGRDGAANKTYTIKIANGVKGVEGGAIEAKIDKDKLVSVTGTIGEEKNRQVGIMVTDPTGILDYLASSFTTEGGNFKFSYTLANDLKGTYNVSVGAADLLTPLSASFLYDFSVPELDRLEISKGSLTPDFSGDKMTYSVKVGHNINTVKVTPYASDPLLTITVNGSKVQSGNSSGTINLEEGVNSISITVTNPEEMERTYTIKVTREYAPLSGNANLSNLAVSAGSLNPAFSSRVVSYSVCVDNNVTAIRVTPTVEDTTASVNVNNQTVVSGSASGDISLNVGHNAISVAVTAQNGTVKTYVLGVTRRASANADLAGINLSSGSLNEIFAAGRLDYTVNVANGVTGIAVTPVLADNAACVAVEGGANLVVGANTITITVTAQDGTVKIYKITVNRDKSSNANLKALSTTGGALDPAFASDIFDYTVSVPNNIVSVKVSAAKAEANATVLINGIDVSDSGDLSGIGLIVGNNIITVKVTAQDGITVKTYTVNVFREYSDNAYLKNLTVSAGSPDSPFSPVDTAYTINTDYSVSAITVTPTVYDSNATVRVNGKAINSGSASEAININPGINYIYVKVTAQNGSEITYTLTVIRARSNSAFLKDITVSAGTLDPVFDKTKTDYKVNVDFSVNEITLGITTEDEDAIITVDGHYGYNNKPYTKRSLEIGDNLITIVVYAPDGETQKTYKVTVNRGYSANADLNNILIVSSGEESGIAGFNPNTLNYTVSVPNSVQSIKLKPFAADSASNVKVNGVNVASGGTSNPINLSTGVNNMITIDVSAQNGVNKKTYTITMVRGYSANLGMLKIENSQIYPGGITLSPAFGIGTQDYSASVAYQADNITVIPTALEQGAVIKVNGTTVESGHASAPVALNVGENTISITVTAPDNTAKTYSIKVTRGLPNIAELSGLAVSTGSLDPTFSPGTINYTVEVSSHTGSITVTPTPSDINATIAVTKTGGAAVNGSGGAYKVDDLAFGTNWIIIKVTAQNGTSTKTYNIKVERLYSYDATLSALEISSGTLNPAFRADVTDYTVNVANDVGSITFTPTVNDTYASVAVNGKPVNSGSASEVISLPVGSKKITVEVKPQIGAYKYYYVTVTRAQSGNADLCGLSVSKGILDPVFSPDTNAYTMTVNNDVTKLKVTPTSADSTATVKVNGQAVIGGNASQDIGLEVGPNTINVAVTAQNGAEKIYTITVTRAPSSNADLSGITLSTGSLKEPFSAEGLHYTMDVANGVTGIAVTPVLADPIASMAVFRDDVGIVESEGKYIASLHVGDNRIKITVTAEDGTSKDYTVTVTRAGADNANLKSLEVIKWSLTPAFSRDIVEYSIEVYSDTEYIQVNAIADDPHATIEISDESDGKVTLDEGATTVTITVTAEDGNTAKDYIITVTRSENAEPKFNIWCGENILHGTLTVDKKTAAQGETVSLTITPHAGYRLKEGSLLGYYFTDEMEYIEFPITGSNFVMPSADVSIRVEFEPILFSITIDDDIIGGVIQVDGGASKAAEKTLITIFVYSNGEDWQLVEGSVKYKIGTEEYLISISAGEYSASFEMPAADILLTALFKNI